MQRPGNAPKDSSRVVDKVFVETTFFSDGLEKSSERIGYLEADAQITPGNIENRASSQGITGSTNLRHINEHSGRLDRSCGSPGSYFRLQNIEGVN